LGGDSSYEHVSNSGHRPELFLTSGSKAVIKIFVVGLDEE